MLKFLVAAALACSLAAAGAVIHLASEVDELRDESKRLSTELAAAKSEAASRVAAEARAAESRSVEVAGSVAAEDEVAPDPPGARADIERAGGRRTKALLANVTQGGDSDPEPIAAETPSAAEDDAALFAGSDEVFREQVRETLATLREEEDAERRERRKARRHDEVRERVKGYAEKLHLAPYQEDELVRIYTEQGDRRDEIMDRARQDELPWLEARTLADENRKQTDEQVRELLSSDQFAGLEKLRQEERDNMGPGGWLRGQPPGGAGSAVAPQPQGGGTQERPNEPGQGQ